MHGTQPRRAPPGPEAGQAGSHHAQILHLSVAAVAPNHLGHAHRRVLVRQRSCTWAVGGRGRARLDAVGSGGCGEDPPVPTRLRNPRTGVAHAATARGAHMHAAEGSPCPPQAAAEPAARARLTENGYRVRRGLASVRHVKVENVVHAGNHLRARQRGQGRSRPSREQLHRNTLQPGRSTTRCPPRHLPAAERQSGPRSHPGQGPFSAARGRSKESGWRNVSFGNVWAVLGTAAGDSARQGCNPNFPANARPHPQCCPISQSRQTRACPPLHARRPTSQ